jgi:CubicO group peptidase (beta-lactamase class C family)
MIKKIALSVLPVLFVLTTNAQQKKAEAEINDLLQKTEAVGFSVAVVKDNKVIYTQAFGQKNLETKTPLSTTDIFRIASISKSFAATAIMQLVEAKKLSLDDDFSGLVGFKVRNPLYPNDVITLRMVLSHTSSIADKQGYGSLDLINPDKNENWAKSYTDKKPGTAYLYCNLNYNMTGAVVERATGVRYDKYIETNILQPLGLYGSLNVNSLDANRFASLYAYRNNRLQLSPKAYDPRKAEFEVYQLGYSTPILSPTGGMKITPTDLAKYMIMHMNYGKANGKTIISEASAKIMQTPISSDDQYGLALKKTDSLVKGKTLVGHTGSANGLYSSMFFSPEEKFGIVVMTNGINTKLNGGPRKSIVDVYNILYKNFIKN